MATVVSTHIEPKIDTWSLLIRANGLPQYYQFRADTKGEAIELGKKWAELKGYRFVQVMPAIMDIRAEIQRELERDRPRKVEG